MRSLESSRSSASASTISFSLRTSVRALPRNSPRASCCVIVLAPWRTPPARRLAASARALPRRSSPQCERKRRSSDAITACAARAGCARAARTRGRRGSSPAAPRAARARAGARAPSSGARRPGQAAQSLHGGEPAAREPQPHALGAAVAGRVGRSGEAAQHDLDVGGRAVAHSPAARGVERLAVAARGELGAQVLAAAACPRRAAGRRSRRARETTTTAPWRGACQRAHAQRKRHERARPREQRGGDEPAPAHAAARRRGGGAGRPELTGRGGAAGFAGCALSLMDRSGYPGPLESRQRPRPDPGVRGLKQRFSRGLPLPGTYAPGYAWKTMNRSFACSSFTTPRFTRFTGAGAWARAVRAN